MPSNQRLTSRMFADNTVDYIREDGDRALCSEAGKLGPCTVRFGSAQRGWVLYSDTRVGVPGPVQCHKGWGPVKQA